MGTHSREGCITRQNLSFLRCGRLELSSSFPSHQMFEAIFIIHLEVDILCLISFSANTVAVTCSVPVAVTHI